MNGSVEAAGGLADGETHPDVEDGQHRHGHQEKNHKGNLVNREPLQCRYE